MHERKSLAITCTDNGPQTRIHFSVLIGDHASTSCYAFKHIAAGDIAEMRDVIAWMSSVFLHAADELHQEGWEVQHSADCSEAHMAVTDA